MSGVKLTVLLPLLNQQIKHAVKATNDGKITYTVVLCHSNGRCAELAEFASEVADFCKDIIDIVNFPSSMDIQDMVVDFKQRSLTSNGNSAESDEEIAMAKVKLRNKVLFLTPQTAKQFF